VIAAAAEHRVTAAADPTAPATAAAAARAERAASAIGAAAAAPPAGSGTEAGAAVAAAADGATSAMTPRNFLHFVFVQQGLPLCSGLNLPPTRHELLSPISVVPQMVPSVSPGPWHGPPCLTMLRSPRARAYFG
tara:strand:+ start:1315 stop:1716 length:402 start_codon:yes stop_codon:yes gene_type:complete